MVIGQFLDYMRYERNKSLLTVHGYNEDLHDFETYLKGVDSNLSLETADSDLIRGWMESMVDKGNAATSVNRRLSAVRSFYRFALMRGIVNKDPAHAVRSPKKERPLPQFLRECEMDTLLDSGIWTDNFKDVRARTIFMMFYETGLRVSELVGLDDGAVDTVSRSLRVTGKGGKQRVVPFGEELSEAITRYRLNRNVSVASGDAFFVTTKGVRLNTAQVRYIVKKHLECVTSLKKKSPHVLRHTFATAMLNHGAGIESIKKLLGHAKIDTTEVYTHTTFEQLKRVYKQAHPRA